MKSLSRTLRSKLTFGAVVCIGLGSGLGVGRLAIAACLGCVAPVQCPTNTCGIQGETCPRLTCGAGSNQTCSCIALLGACTCMVDPS